MKVDGPDVIAFLTTLSKFADYYTKLLNPHLEEHVEIRKYVQRIHDFEAKTAYPFLLYTYRDYKEGKYSAEEFIEILKIIENYLVVKCKIKCNS